MKNDKVINRLGCQYCLAPLAQHFSCCVSPPLSWCRLLLRKLSFFARSFCDVADRASSTDPAPSKPFFAIEQRQSSGDRASQRRRSAQTVMMLPSGSLWVFLYLENLRSGFQLDNQQKRFIRTTPGPRASLCHMTRMGTWRRVTAKLACANQFNPRASLIHRIGTVRFVRLRK